MTTFTYTNPTVGGSEDTWGTTLNANWTALGTFLGTLDSTELAVLDGITASTAELNLLDGATLAISAVTATAAELNLLDGATLAIPAVTATAAELNYVDGVTSPIQTQLNAKASTNTQSTATWQAGTGTTQSIVSPANVKAAVLALETITPTSGSAPYYGCRAWGYVSTGSPVAVDGSGNVASVVRNSTGKYTITFAVAMPNDNYAINIGPNSQGTSQFYEFGMTSALTAKSAASFQIQFRRSTNHDVFDCSNWSFSVVG